MWKNDRILNKNNMWCMKETLWLKKKYFNDEIMMFP